MPGVPFFDCVRLHASLTTVHCAEMWRLANEGRSERHSACRACPIGAAHAGVSNASRSPIRGALVCSRCGRGSTRLVRANLCVSCYNRERECVKGRNARGAIPVKLTHLDPRRICFTTDGLIHQTRTERTAGVAELYLATLRDAVHTVAFGWRGQRAGIRQARLF